jgi:hypothetical protein
MNITLLFYEMKRVLEEKEQLEHLCQEPLVSRLKEEYHKRFGFTFETINPVGGRRHHYDLLIDDIIRVEYKGSKSKMDITRPWSNGVQFLNGAGKSFSIGHWYATAFYPHLTTLKELHNVTEPLPTYEEWIKDAFAQGKPTTPFVCELREKTNKGKKCSAYRTIFNKSFELSKEQLEQLASEVYMKANQVLSEKDCWLQVNQGTIRWSPKVEMPPIIKSEQIRKNDADIQCQFTCQDGSIFKAKLRWGYGQCITNLRVDLS